MAEYVPNLGRSFVRVTGERLSRFVEFEFSINDQDLTVELILPHAEFKAFCERHQATVIQNPKDIDAGTGNSGPGLYQRPAFNNDN